jgi:hypothetical protein
MLVEKIYFILLCFLLSLLQRSEEAQKKEPRKRIRNHVADFQAEGSHLPLTVCIVESAGCRVPSIPMTCIPSSGVITTRKETLRM